MDKFTTLTAVAAPLPRDNIDTDIILPSEVVTRMGTDMARIGEGAFDDWRKDRAGKPRPEFVLNQPCYGQAQILVTGNNFGCGSSREHAVWALLGAGFRCVIARSFGDIFFGNCLKKGLLPVTLAAEPHQRVMRWAGDVAGSALLTVDLENTEIRFPDGDTIGFSIDPEARKALLLGLDEIGTTLQYETDIANFQARDRAARPWVYDVDFHRSLEG
jgi:3-isopropylmalate/(R)-2-methylmalate dehydratase small subunit